MKRAIHKPKVERIKIKAFNGKSPAWRGNIPITSRYTAGAAGDRFFKAMKEEGKILATYCEKCRVSYAPAKLFCERCFAQLDNNWKEAGDSGKLYSFTAIHIDMDGKKINPPQIAALIELGNSGAKIVHLLGETDFSKLKIGIRVQAVWKEPGQREGKITDIKYFKPIA